MKLERSEFLNSLIKENNFKSYLEIGHHTGVNFDNIEVQRKISVDPEFEPTYKMTSDEFFKQNKKTFDIVFVDGLHLVEQVIKDVENSIKVLRKGGLIVIHDCLPEIEVRQNRVRTTSNWQGDVWKAIVYFASKDYYMELHEVETGIVVLKDSKKEYNIADIPLNSLTWKWYTNNFKNLFI